MRYWLSRVGGLVNRIVEFKVLGCCKLKKESNERDIYEVWGRGDWFFVVRRMKGKDKVKKGIEIVKEIMILGLRE